MTPDKVRHNGFSEKLGTDVIAVDANGNILGRAGNREAAAKACPDAVAFFTGTDFEGVSSSQIAKAAAQPNDALARVVAQVDPAVLADYASPDVIVQFDGDPEDPPFVAPDAEPTPPVKITSTTEAPAEAAPETPVADGSAFDHDGDGRVGGGAPGGNKPKASRQRKPASK